MGQEMLTGTGGVDQEDVPGGPPSLPSPTPSLSRKENHATTQVCPKYQCMPKSIFFSSAKTLFTGSEDPYCSDKRMEELTQINHLSPPKIILERRLNFISRKKRHGFGRLSGSKVEVDGVELIPQGEQRLQEESPPGPPGHEADRVVPPQRLRTREARRRLREPRAAADLDLRAGGHHEAPRPGPELEGHRARLPVEPRDDVEQQGARALLLRPHHRQGICDRHSRQIERLDHGGCEIRRGTVAPVGRRRRRESLGDEAEGAVDGGFGAAAFGPGLHRQGGAVHGGEDEGAAAGFLRERHQLGAVGRRDGADPV